MPDPEYPTDKDARSKGGAHANANIIPREGEYDSKFLETQHWLELVDG